MVTMFSALSSSSEATMRLRRSVCAGALRGAAAFAFAFFAAAGFLADGLRAAGFLGADFLAAGFLGLAAFFLAAFRTGLLLRAVF